MIIVSLPPVHHEQLLRDIITHPSVNAVRYNTGMDSAYPPAETLAKILELTSALGKPLYVDLKGQQLRIVEWATFPNGPIVLNHDIDIEFPATVFFRGDDACVLKEVVDKRKIYVDPFPKHPVGRGQAVNILAKRIAVNGYFTENDDRYISAAVALGITRFMLSFVESTDYIAEFQKKLCSTVALRDGGAPDDAQTPKHELVLKIESAAGVEFVRNTEPGLLGTCQLMAARDDLMIQIGGINMLEALRVIIEKDALAICASRLLLGLAETGAVTAADISDLRLMQIAGYRRFMFSDGISARHFSDAIAFWDAYWEACISRYALPQSRQFIGAAKRRPT